MPCFLDVMSYTSKLMIFFFQDDIKSFSSKLNEVTDTQKKLEEKVDNIEWNNKNFIIEELERLEITDKINRYKQNIMV